MPFRRRLRAFALLASLAAASSPAARAEAQEPVDAANSANVAAARSHFERGREDYGKGAYREAVTELEAAHTLDPSAKDLVFNLGVVHEKLSDIDDALKYFQLYTTMNVTDAERERADSYIRRLEGAKKEVAQTPAAPAGSTPASPTTANAGAAGETDASSSVGSARSLVPASSANGRVDAATVTALGVAAAALVFGAVMGVKAEGDQPISGFVTGQNGATYEDLAASARTAHREAVIADIAFGASLAAGITATVLYFARPRDAAPAARTARPATVSAAPLMGGGALLVQGSL